MNYPMNAIVFFLLIITIVLYASSNSKISEREMTMIIISKDKTKCAEYNRISVQRAFGGKGNKYAIVGSVNHHDDTLNYYSDKESAVAELERIFAAYQNGEKTYTF